jgi:hypothetical protein
MISAAKPAREPGVRERPVRWWLAALVWAVCLAALLAGGFAALVAWIAWHAGASPGPVQLQAWIAIATRVLEQALLPLWAATLASWLALARGLPALDRGWRTLAPGVALLAALWFAPVGAFGFTMWTPRDAHDVIGTVALCAGGVSVALLLPRWLWRRLAPGAFSAARPSG